jgi:hypothetical protein
MNSIIRKISSDSINSYIEKNLDNFYTKSSTHSNFTSNIDNKISYVLALRADWPSCIFKANFKNLNIEEEINNIKNLIQDGKAPNSWTIGPLTNPKDLGKSLEKTGFLNVYHQSGMAINLSKLKKNKSNIQNFKCLSVKDEDTLLKWSKVVASVFSIKLDFEFLQYLLSENDTHLYIGTYNRNVVSALLLFLSAGVAGLHAVSTLPDYRGRGFAFFISGKALNDALKMGHKVGVLQASSLGEKIYKKLGFKKYCDIISYEYQF